LYSLNFHVFLPLFLLGLPHFLIFLPRSATVACTFRLFFQSFPLLFSLLSGSCFVSCPRVLPSAQLASFSPKTHRNLAFLSTGAPCLFVSAINLGQPFNFFFLKPLSPGFSFWPQSPPPPTTAPRPPDTFPPKSTPEFVVSFPPLS